MSLVHLESLRIRGCVFVLIRDSLVAPLWEPCCEIPRTILQIDRAEDALH
jgi:hypothetical protein